MVGEVIIGQSYLGSSIGWVVKVCGVSVAGRGGRSNAASLLLFQFFLSLQEANCIFLSITILQGQHIKKEPVWVKAQSKAHECYNSCICTLSLLLKLLVVNTSKEWNTTHQVKSLDRGHTVHTKNKNNIKLDEMSNHHTSQTHCKTNNILPSISS